MAPKPPGTLRDASLALALVVMAGAAPVAGAECRRCAAATWERLATAPAPPARLDASICVDPKRGVVYLFGGRSGTGFLADLWALDTPALRWRQLEGQGPPARSGASLVVEPGSGRLLLFGGYRSDDVGQLKLFNDLWTYTAERGWSREYTAGPPGPRAWHAAMAADGEMLVYGGWSRPAGSPGAYLRELWALDLEVLAWRRAATDGGPHMAGRPALSSRAGEKVLVVFGRDGVPIPASGGFHRLALEADRWDAPEVVSGLPLDFDLVGTGAGERVLLLRGPTFLAPAWGVWTAAPGRACCEHAAEGGPAGSEGIACAPEPGREDAWLCFGGAREKDISGATWRIRLPAEGVAP